ncbi:TIR domain-containing protein [Bacteroides thetaiotaomicron]|uniref:TIR domain-containing protein n=1 Tax=Bacteroidaceae TaxID=815 RepID=UPI0001A2783F|nr:MULTISPECIES: TIR domain-containing protein [Bacteroidaceae]EEO46232.1 tetratricopeptide repeat protein [Phocaeicola dorei 5_1_36/D4]MCR8892278.1 toll/interleukin-1 receptor domain-containing protein [Bacteroides sp. ET336]MDN0056775.1 TIR domain-containing protein [Bacteroides caecigallinarum]
MIKAFISHSSEQKQFVLDLVEILGRDYCIVDCYNFNSAYQTINEIYDKIDKSTVFVLLLSKASLSSEWVKEEIRYVREKLEPGCLERFWPFIIDENLSIEECPEWMKKDKCFNLKKFKSCKILAHDIEQKFRRIIWSKNPKRKQLETLMVGRNKDIDNFENIYQSARGMNLRALVISGRDGVGKDMFISKCLDKIGGYDAESTPFYINLGNKEGIENFIIQLNLITRTYDETQLMTVLGGNTSEKTSSAANLVNELLNTNSVISINDDLSCVLPNRKLADWLIDLVEKSNIANKLGLFIKSHKILDSFSEIEHPFFGHINLSPLDSKDRLKLFYSLLRIYNLTDISEEDVKWFVGKLLLSPSQLVKAVEALSCKPLAFVKKDINTLISWGDMQINPMVEHFFQDEESKHILIILSKLDFVSYEILENIFEERIIEVMEKMDEMIDFGIVSVFGPQEQFFRLDHYLSDYIKRCHIKLPYDLDNLLNEVLEEKIASSNITEDVSVYLYDKKRQILSGKGKPEDFLIPSVVVTSVMEIYNNQDYKQVIKLCDLVLNDVHNYFPDQERELRYWLCLALARTTNKQRFFEEVQHFRGTDYFFLRGFYHRNAMEYSQAEKCFNEALEKSPNLQRAKREKVTALLAQKKYEQALGLAKENYENNPENSYQIHGYFRCLVRKTPLIKEDVDMLKHLMAAMQKNLSDKQEELYTAMDIEFRYFVSHDSPSDMIKLINNALSIFPNSINVKRAAQPFKLHQSIIFKEESFPEEC